MSHIVSNSSSARPRLWDFVEAELLKGNAFLLPLRLFIGLGWLRAGVEKGIDPLWISGEYLLTFFRTQIAADAISFPFYESMITHLFAPNVFVLSWIILVGEILAGLAILTGTLTNLALIGGLFMNLNFVLAGVVSPSAFYIVIQAALLSGNAGATLGLDSMLTRYIYPDLMAASAKPELSNRPLNRWVLLLSGILCTLVAMLVLPYIHDFGPHSVDDPAMLLFILLMLSAMLLGIHFTRISSANNEL